MGELIVQPSYAGVSGEAVIAAIPIARQVAAVAGDFSDGNSAAAVLDFGVGLLDVAAMLADPIGTLGSSAAAFLIDYLEPLHQELEMLTGSPEQVKALAATWTNLATALQENADTHRQVTEQVLAQWEGPAAESYRKSAEGVVAVIEQCSGACTGAANSLQTAAVVVQVVYEVVKGIISDLVGQLISLVVEELATVGLGTPVVITQACAKIAAKAPKVAKWVEEAQKVLGDLAKKINDFMAITKDLEKTMTEVNACFLHVETATRVIDIAIVDVERTTVKLGTHSVIDFKNVLRSVVTGVRSGTDTSEGA